MTENPDKDDEFAEFGELFENLPDPKDGAVEIELEEDIFLDKSEGKVEDFPSEKSKADDGQIIEENEPDDEDEKRHT